MSNWSDLRARLGSAVVMVLIGATAVYLGGVWFHALVALIGGGMIWELRTMMAPEKSGQALPSAILSGVAIMALTMLSGPFLFPILLAAVIVASSGVTKDKGIFAAYAIGLLLACYGLILLRDVVGIQWVLWLILVVIGSDVAGYFAGRLLGGPKFWPKVSPKKTWSGTVAGWVVAAGVGAYFGGFSVIIFSIVTSFAGQMGDIAESAIKRRCGIKDSSNLIPGHGGLLDRFDAMMGAALLVVLVGLIFGLPMDLQ